MNYRTKIWWYAFRWPVKHGPPGGRAYCGTHVESSWTCIPDREVRVIIRDTTRVYRSSREEVYAMLTMVRQQEVLMGWKCPEPPMPTLVTIPGKQVA